MTAEEATTKALQVLDESADSDSDLADVAAVLSREMFKVERDRHQRLPLGDDLPSRSAPVAVPTSVPTRRRRGVLARRDPETGAVLTRSY